jgi:hypothetical protein
LGFFIRGWTAEQRTRSELKGITLIVCHEPAVVAAYIGHSDA